MRTDEVKALRLRRTQLQAEIARIDALLDGATPMPKRHSETANRRGGDPANREQFYRDAENDFRNCDSNGNYCAHDPGDEDPKAWNNEEA